VLGDRIVLDLKRRSESERGNYNDDPTHEIARGSNLSQPVKDSDTIASQIGVGEYHGHDSCDGQRRTWTPFTIKSSNPRRDKTLMRHCSQYASSDIETFCRDGSNTKHDDSIQKVRESFGAGRFECYNER
jgi:hypothetical protein